MHVDKVATRLLNAQGLTLTPEDALVEKEYHDFKSRGAVSLTSYSRKSKTSGDKPLGRNKLGPRGRVAHAGASQFGGIQECGD